MAGKIRRTEATVKVAAIADVKKSLSIAAAVGALAVIAASVVALPFLTVSSMERIFLIASFILEIPSAVFDQLSSVHRPHYALANMLISFAVMIVSIADLVYKGRKARITWTKKGFIPWFYHPHPNSKPFGSLVDIIGLVCAIFQCIFASIAYMFLSWRVDNPIKVSIWPMIFAFFIVLHSRLSEKHFRKRSRKLNGVEEFTLAELTAATTNFSADNQVGTTRLAVVYRGRLLDDREVFISRRVIDEGDKEAERVHESSLAFYSRLHHRNLLGLLGYCEEGTERLLVFDYLKNGNLCTQLFLKESSAIDSWIMRIKIALDTARGIDYLHNYAVPPIIHRGLKSACICLYENWIPKIGVMGPESERDYISKSAVKEDDGYIDPEYYALNILTTKSDVYSFGVVLLELLTGRRAIFIDGNNGSKPTRLVDFAVPTILQNELVQILDRRVGLPKSDNEAEAVTIMAYTAIHSVNSQGINRPAIKDIVANSEQALSLIDSIRISDTGNLQNSPVGK